MKLINHFQNELKICIPKPKEILKKCKSSRELIEFVGRTSFRLELRYYRDLDAYNKNTNVFKPGIPLYMYLSVFLMNRIPSDLYRIRNPKLEIIKSLDGYWFIKSQANNQVNNQVENGSNQKTKGGVEGGQVI